MTKTIAIAPVRKSLTRERAASESLRSLHRRNVRGGGPPTHTLLKSPFKAAIIEPREGGRWYQVGEDGSTSENGSVRVWDPPSRVVLVWRPEREVGI